jgi:alpha-2-macroglobulin
LGPFKTGKNGKNNHKIYMPNYIGKVRLMIVACNDKNFGKYEKLIPVKNPLMVQTQLPRSLNVTDKLNLPVTILRDDKTISNANLTAKADPTMVKGLTGNVPLAFGGKNQLSYVYENIEVLNKTGKVIFDLGINSGNKGMKESTNILVNYPNSYESSIKKDIVEPNQSIKMTIEPKGYKEVFTSKVMISGLKVPNFTQYASELIDYPYGCLEQTTSGGFGQLYLDKILNLDPTENRKRLEHLQSAMLALGRFQDGTGKFKYWESNYYHAWSDVYAGNFLVEMKKQNQLGGYFEMLDRWTAAHNTVANNWALAEVSNDYTYESETMVQAYRLFVLAKAGKSAKSALNRFVTSNKSRNPLTWWLIAGSFKLSGYESKALEYVKKAESLQKDYNESYSYHSFGDKGRDWAIIVEVLSYIEKDQNKLEAYYDQMVDILNNQGWASTQTKGYAFIAAYQYFGKSLQMAKDVEYTISGLTSGTKSFKHSSYEPKMVYIQKADFSKPISVKNTGKSKLYVYQTSRFIDSNPKKDGASNNLGIAVSYSNSTRKQSGLKGTKLGDDIIINVSITNPSALNINDLALNVKMPSGWELINPRLYETNVVPDAGNYNYQDYRDDRVYTFFGLRPGEKRNFSFKAKAAFTGDFFMPAISCEHMYKGTIYAKTSTERVLVGK